MESVDIAGRIVIGEGERDEAPMLYIGEEVGTGRGPSVDIAVDPLEGTNLCATGAAGAIAVLAAAEEGGLLHAPDIYMEKIVVPGVAADRVDLDAPVADNLAGLADALDRDVDDLVIIVLDRPRHEKLIADIRAAGARIRLIQDGDLSAGISAAVSGTGVHAVMGTGGAPEGVLTAAAMRCLNGAILGRLVTNRPADTERMKKMGIADLDRVYRTEDLAPGEQRHLRRRRRDRRDAPAGRALLRGRDPHPLPGDDDPPAPGPLHRHDPRRGQVRIRSSGSEPLLFEPFRDAL